jgi:hypothetical protein
VIKAPHTAACLALAWTTCPLAQVAEPGPSGSPAEEASSAERRENPSRFRDPQDGQIDLSDFLASSRGFLPVPIVITEPAVGYGGGAVGMFLRPREEAGSEGWARPNISALGALGTENGTRGAFAADVSRWRDGRFKTLAVAGVGRVNLDFYGLGADSESFDEPIRYSLDFGLGLLQGNWRVKPDSPWSLGVRYIYAEVEPKLRDEPPASLSLPDRVDVKVSAPSAIIEFDSRDNIFTPTRGLYAETFYMASRESLGASDDFERLQQVVMFWLPAASDVTLGVRADYQWASDDAPFFLRPYVKLRGVQAMRYQGEETASAEIEARWRFRGRWSAIAAAGAGTARTDRPELSGSQDVVSGALGVRYELARKFGLHAGMDVGFSEETTAIYFQVGNAWFRP